MYYITVPEGRESLIKHYPDAENVITLKENQALLPQIMPIPTGESYKLMLPGSWPEEEKKKLALQVSGAMIAMELSRNTVHAFKDAWAENAFWNHDAALNASPIHALVDLPLKDKPALIIGSGPSANGFKIPDGVVTYAAWSALKNLDQAVDFIVHCDHREQASSPITPKQGIIFTPVTAKEFIGAYPDAPQFVYYDRGNEISWRFAEKRGCLDHDPIMAHVVDMALLCALYAGHKEIMLIGCDLCCLSVDELTKYHPNIQEAFEVHNYRGELVYTDEVFEVCQQGIQELVNRNPAVTFSNLGETGVIIEGIPYAEV